jgi:hypothetical protein
VIDSAWDDYCTAAERVIVDGELLHRGRDYTLNTATGDISFASYINGYELKILYTRSPLEQKIDEFEFDADGITTVNLTYGPIADEGSVEAIVNIDNVPPTIITTFTATADGMQVIVTGGEGDIGDTGKIIYQTIRGQYEWVIVGAGAASVDSAGAAYVTEAFDSLKNIPVHKVGLDQQDTNNGPEVPYVFRNDLGTGESSYFNGAGNEGMRDELGRVYLKNHFCNPYHPNPIVTSNIIYVGGPLVNMGSYYMNDFMPEFYANEYAVDWAQGWMVKQECWSTDMYSGHVGVISVYKDIDGTVHMAIWGMTGQDTYYLAMWFWYGLPTYKMSLTSNGFVRNGAATTVPGIVYLQTENPGVTTINFGIKPTCNGTVGAPLAEIEIYERLGTISEKNPHTHDPEVYIRGLSTNSLVQIEFVADVIAREE